MADAVMFSLRAMGTDRPRALGMAGVGGSGAVRVGRIVPAEGGTTHMVGHVRVPARLGAARSLLIEYRQD